MPNSTSPSAVSAPSASTRSAKPSRRSRRRVLPSSIASEPYFTTACHDWKLTSCAMPEREAVHHHQHAVIDRSQRARRQQLIDQ